MKIVTLSTYPVSEPRHGGQHRLANIAREFRRAGHEVHCMGIVGGEGMPPEEGFLPFPSRAVLGQYIENAWLMEDWALGRWAADDFGGFAALSAIVPPDVDVIHIEQPWLFAFAQRLREHARRRIHLIYGSANVEHRLKQEILTPILGAEHAKRCAELVLDCEVNALRAADAVCAVSEADAEWSRTYSRGPLILAPNGVAERSFSFEDVKAANQHTGHHKYALYCASGHPPNVVGFYDLFGEGLGCLAPTDRLVVAGGAGPAILEDPRTRFTPGLQRHLIAAGLVSETVLAALLGHAHAIILPITQGGGTNLKTAEALWSGCHVVATSVAMRGFEAFADAPGVSVEDETSRFRTAVREAMTAPPLQLEAHEQKRRRAVLWEECLRPWVQHVGGIGA
ncbi:MULTISPECIES: glycosyltransferase [Rubrivivax]|uniref:Glycosyltransferase family 4 protein n=1 Tax=Rubrivivax benzoatilyticus TaxID=316997 RepID=A0ABX0HX42_9BURK|nr:MULTISPECIES: glycosyltransferase [Rubrivivax]EGJ09955.1 glycosyltransferase [Rubrivivax benzoatilyticus JA2 = ATCC BAA-35]NHK97944.1 glycosyltransferase family 4 protein [Rubrivivax benzoatilyticus]NHL23446.1 glycosyltransferase family 4 protein [Rubrivivax benzoatilyticus]